MSVIQSHLYSELTSRSVAFDQATIPDEFAQARLTAIQSGVPGAILRAVTTNASLAPTAFTTLDGFVNTTSDKYVSTPALVTTELANVGTFVDAIFSPSSKEYVLFVG